jgi:hypothetical protein
MARKTPVLPTPALQKKQINYFRVGQIGIEYFSEAKLLIFDVFSRLYLSLFCMKPVEPF